MRKALCFGFGTGCAIQAWRQFPPDGPITPNAAALLLVVGMLAAYGAGKLRSRGGPVSIAEAHAEATAVAAATAVQNVNVYVTPEHLKQAYTVSELDQAPWFNGPARQLELDELDGAELAELIEETNTETA